MEKKIQYLISDLKNILNDKLVSVFLYGSLVDESYNKAYSDVNIIVVIDKFTASDLKILCPFIKKWKKLNFSLPLFMDKNEWYSSTDIYAIEYTDIINRHKILYGENLIKDLIIDKANLRFQCESELKNILVKLRQNYLLMCDDKKAINNLIINSFKSSMAIFRAILTLLNEKRPLGHQETINLLYNHINFNEKIFLDILEYKKQKKHLPLKELNYYIENLIDAHFSILNFVDKYNINVN